MFKVTPLADALEESTQAFLHYPVESETVPLGDALGRYLSAPVSFGEYVPDFNRSTVDGYALRASDIRGCSEANPGILNLIGSVEMGKPSALRIGAMQAAYVPTGGELPDGADTVVMVEYSESFGTDEVAILRQAAPGANMIFRGDDGEPGETLLPKGRRLTVADIGSLAALGLSQVEVFKPLKIGILSTGDELVPPSQKPVGGQIRDVNTDLLAAFAKSLGFEAVVLPFIKDQEALLEDSITKLVKETDCVLVSGGTSVGVRDNLARVIKKLGEIFIHGLAIKPGKPTIIGKIDAKPIFGLPGNPVAAYFVTRELVAPLLLHFWGTKMQAVTLPAQTAAAFSSNQGREEFVIVTLEDGKAKPIPSKSGLITNLSRANGYIRIPRDSEGLPKGAQVQVTVL